MTVNIQQPRRPLPTRHGRSPQSISATLPLPSQPSQEHVLRAARWPCCVCLYAHRPQHNSSCPCGPRGTPVAVPVAHLSYRSSSCNDHVAAGGGTYSGPLMPCEALIVYPADCLSVRQPFSRLVQLEPPAVSPSSVPTWGSTWGSTFRSAPSRLARRSWAAGPCSPCN